METIKSFRMYKDINGKELKIDYDVIMENQKVIQVYNTAHKHNKYGTWGNSIEKNSETFEYFSNHFNK